MLRKVPLIVILGSTGTGKTKLSLELAERLGGEIISADSMQVYANLDIATAKATQEEQSRAKHHLLDVATPGAEPFTVVQFRNAALPIIENLLAQSKCPIVVGGTNYYIESLLWDILVSPTTTTTSTTTSPTDPDSRSSTKATAATVATAAATSVATASGNLKNSLFLPEVEMPAMSSELLHNHLRKIDPVTANRIHPNNKRKIVRAIEYYQESGHTLSSKLQAQRAQPGGNRLGGPLRYPHTILFWLRCNQDVLNARLDKRVDAMLEQGLLREIRAFHNEHRKCDSAAAAVADKSSADNSYTKGVLQTIGFKEFIPYLEQFNAANDQKIEEYLRLNAFKMPTATTTTATTTMAEIQASSRSKNHNNNNNSTNNEMSSLNDSAATADPNMTMELPPGLELLGACLNELKLVTRRYSKKQIKWINNRFLASKDRQVPALYALDTSDVSAWHEAVFARAAAVIDCHRSGQVCEVEPMARRAHPGAGLDEETSNFCGTCQRHFIGEFQWQLHIKSNKHKKRKEGLNKKKKQQVVELLTENL